MRARFLVGCGALAWALLATAFAFTGVASAAGVGAGVVIEGARGSATGPPGTWDPQDPWSNADHVNPWSPLPTPTEPATVPPEVADAEGAPGSLDVSFSDDGLSTPNLTNGPEDGASVAIQPDGKIVVGGGAGSGNSRVQVARFNADGSRDTSFGGGDGAVQKNISPGPDWIEDIALQPDGKVVAVGSAWGVSFVIRFNSNGTLDTGFGDGGYQLLLVGRSFNAATAVVVDGFGNVAFAGRGGGDGGRIVVARVDAAGAPDLSFGVGGITIVNIYDGEDMAWDLALQPDGKLVVGGSMTLQRLAMVVLRLDEDGELDPTFDSDGIRTFGPRGIPAIATAVAIQEDGAIVAGGLSLDHGGEMIVARITPDGRLDTSWNGARHATVDFSGGQDLVWRLAVQDDGAIVAVGRAGGSGGRFAVARLTAAGALDPSFSGDGKLTTNLTAGDDAAHSVALDGEGDIVASGYADGASGNARIGIVRYLGA